MVEVVGMPAETTPTPVSAAAPTAVSTTTTTTTAAAATTTVHLPGVLLPSALP